MSLCRTLITRLPSLGGSFPALTATFRLPSFPSGVGWRQVSQLQGLGATPGDALRGRLALCWGFTPGGGARGTLGDAGHRTGGNCVQGKLPPLSALASGVSPSPPGAPLGVPQSPSPYSKALPRAPTPGSPQFSQSQGIWPGPTLLAAPQPPRIPGQRPWNQSRGPGVVCIPPSGRGAPGPGGAGPGVGVAS